MVTGRTSAFGRNDGWANEVDDESEMIERRRREMKGEDAIGDDDDDDLNWRRLIVCGIYSGRFWGWVSANLND